MANNDLQKSLQSSSPLFYHAVVEAVEIDLSGQRGNRDSRTLALEQIAEHFKVGVAPAHFGTAQLEGGNIGRQANQVGRVAARW